MEEQLWEKMGPANYQIFYEFVKRGDLSKYVFLDLIFAIDRADILYKIFQLIQENGQCLAKNKEIIAKELLRPLADIKSPVILNELFLAYPEFFNFFPEFEKTVVKDFIEMSNVKDLISQISLLAARPEADLILYNSIRRFVQTKKEEEIKIFINEFLKEIFTNTALIKYSQLLQKLINTLVFSNNRHIQQGVQNFITLHLVNQGAKWPSPKGYFSARLSQHILKIMGEKGRENERKVCFIENSLNLMEETTIKAGLCRLFYMSRQQPWAIDFMFEAVLALKTDKYKQNLYNILKKLDVSLRQDKKSFKSFMTELKTKIQQLDSQRADSILNNY